MNTVTNEKWVVFLLARDGYHCNECKKTLSELKSRIEVDHIDSNSDNNPNDGSNYQLLCASCNTKKYWRKLKGIEERPYTPEMKLNLRAEPKWVNWMINYVTEHHSVCKNEAIANGASLANVSTETTKRYLKKRLGEDGLFELGWGRCTSKLCDETHVYAKGAAPIMEER